MDIPNLSSEGKAAIVTGGKTGMGRDIALAMASAGADVAVCGRVLEGALEAVADDIAKLGRRSLALQVDISRKEDVDNLVDKVMHEFGAIDILVNNAGILVKAPILDTSDEVWDNVMNTNLKGYFLCSQAVGRKMVERKKGAIINLSSDLAFKALPEMGAYCISKASIVMLTQALARELGGHGIRVNSIAPGLIRTEMSRPNWGNPEALAHMESMIPLGRIGETDDIVGLALFLASDASRYITGDIILLNGGGGGVD
jgi:NAD(P)-dependent dehydrogenase (short-subunit alcohol dehydrogenase family)